jgi:MFS family permease
VKRAAGRLYPRSRFLLLYLIPFAVWHFATGAFNPFNNVYFKNLGLSDRRLGSLFAESQLLQVATLLAAPLVMRRLGVARGAGATMLLAAAALAGLAAQPSAPAAMAAFLAYMSFQWMSEPGLNTLLMNGVAEHERSGASSLTYLVAFGAQAAAAFAAGSLFTRFGYGPVLAGAAALAALGAALLPLLLHRRSRTSEARP